jgi:chromate reductase, NAD(P)H dehydrogenase (quinone)
VDRYRVGYFVGSLASDSIKRRLAAALVRLAPWTMAFTEISIKDLPLDSRDYDSSSSSSSPAS